MITHPTFEETEQFEKQGYLQIDSFLPSDFVELLKSRLVVVMDRRQKNLNSHKNGRSLDNPGKRIIVDGLDRRIFHILDDDPAFLDLVDYKGIMPYIRSFLHERPHSHASDAIWEREQVERKPAWHIDGLDRGYRQLRPQIPLLQLKIGYLLSDMAMPDQGNLLIVPGSHLDQTEPTCEQLSGFDTFPGVKQVRGPPGTAVMFHNALWHTHGPKNLDGGQRIMLYYAYEVPWIMGNPEHWSYSTTFYNGLKGVRRELFHGFVFEPSEYRFT